jgi:hypothetical protein
VILPNFIEGRLETVAVTTTTSWTIGGLYRQRRLHATDQTAGWFVDVGIGGRVAYVADGAADG